MKKTNIIVRPMNELSGNEVEQLAIARIETAYNHTKILNDKWTDDDNIKTNAYRRVFKELAERESKIDFSKAYDKMQLFNDVAKDVALGLAPSDKYQKTFESKKQREEYMRSLYNDPENVEKFSPYSYIGFMFEILVEMLAKYGKFSYTLSEYSPFINSVANASSDHIDFGIDAVARGNENVPIVIQIKWRNSLKANIDWSSMAKCRCQGMDEELISQFRNHNTLLITNCSGMSINTKDHYNKSYNKFRNAITSVEIDNALNEVGIFSKLWKFFK